MQWRLELEDGRGNKGRGVGNEMEIKCLLTSWCLLLYKDGGKKLLGFVLSVFSCHPALNLIVGT